MINTVPQTMSIAPEDYVRYYNRIYDTAAKGVEVDKVLSRTDGIQTVIGAEAANAAAYAGARQYRAQQSAYNADIEAQLANQQHNESGSVIDETKGAADLAVRKVADAVSGKTGYTIRLVDGSRSESGERGSFSSSKGEIVVDVSSGNAVSTVLHETAHYIELNAPEDFRAMADEIRSVLSSKEITTDSGTISMLQYAADNYARVYSERYGENVTAQQVMAEITADSAEALLYKDGFLESLLSDEHTVTELAKNDKSAFARFMDKVREIIATIKEYLNSKGRNNSISKVVEENAAALERIEKLYMQGLENAKKNYDSAAKAETGEEAADNKKAAEDSGSKYSIKVDMSEEERYNELKDKNLVVVDYNEDKLNSELEKKGISIDFEELKRLKEKQAKKSIKEIAKALGIHNVNYNNSNINFDFGFSSNSLDSSVHHQGDFKGTYADYAKMLSCLDGIIENAELVEIHPNYKGNKLLKQVYVLVSAFNGGNVIIPVQLEVKEQYDKNNGLYLNVVLGQIKKEPAVKKEIGDAKAYKDLPLVTGSTISLSQLFANVNTGDNKFLKYIPDKFLSEEQVAAKRTAQKADYTKYGRYKEIFEGKSEQKFSLSDPLNRTYSYAELTAKPDMVINTVDKIKLPMENGNIVRTDVVKMALKNVADTSNGWNKEGKVFLYNNDLGRNVKVSSKSIHHGLNRKSENNAIASIALPQYFSEAICINELAPRDYNNKSYVMLGMFNYNDTDYYVRMVVDERNNVCEIEDINVLYAINAKKRPAANSRPGLLHPNTGHSISISQLLDIVKPRCYQAARP